MKRIKEPRGPFTPCEAHGESESGVNCRSEGTETILLQKG